MTTVLAANDGGHIMQLWTLAQRFTPADDRLWVTVPTAQTESLLAGERVTWVGPAPTRDWKAALRNAAAIRTVFRTNTVDRVVSTGSSLAISALPHAAARRIPAHYIESVTRTDGISFSGKMLELVPGVSLYVQWPHLVHGRWRYEGSVLDGFAPHAAEPRPIRRVVVSVGTSGTFGFRRLLDQLVAQIPTGVDVLWQTGSTDVAGLPITARPSVPAAELTAAIESADVLIAHAGAGIALTALEAGKVPILVPRKSARGEHVDDHQDQIARRLGERRLAVVVDADDLTWGDVERATCWSAERLATPAPFPLKRRGDRAGR
jgi:UDP-N-acetylglucosamine transferase subunit ALG13